MRTITIYRILFIVHKRILIFYIIIIFEFNIQTWNKIMKIVRFQLNQLRLCLRVPEMQRQCTAHYFNKT